MIEIREGRQSDIQQAVELGKSYHKESGLGSMEFNELKAYGLCEYLLQSGLGLVAEDNGQLVGMMGAIITSHIFSDTPIAQDVLIYVKPDYRGQGISGRLVDVYVIWARDKGVKPENIFLGINSGIKSEQTENKYKTLGFQRFGVSMRLEV